MQEKVHIHKINKRKLMISTRELKEKRGRREKKAKKIGEGEAKTILSNSEKTSQEDSHFNRKYFC